MIFILIFFIGAFAGYLYGYKIKPNNQLRNALKEIREKGNLLLEDARKGVYKTIVTDQSASSELVVEVKELALTQAGQVKVEYLGAFYKNPAFRTRKGEALLQEVQGLLGDYLPQNEIEWYDTSARQDNMRELIQTLDEVQKTHLAS
ncbi:hypothetical protein TH63_05400 [Rufibacter radiotolerans]|uniref:Uncharacterized protein n=1 Tax=Rufibacter radiotolerans TaxID=1379910 RepID=A0A0H4VN78_9BACT|nr:hypothetical protein [Rufibacter radiotolerans]AKQ45194.1 hypothetical protein TH63_05400 [Rufibacter radiotolerans]